MMKPSRTLLSLLLVLTLVACGSSKSTDSDDDEAEKKKPLPICPQVAIVRDLEEIKDYGQETPDPDQLVAKARMTGVDGTCEYVKNGIDIHFNLNFAAKKGPRLGGLHTSFPYFISILDPDQKIISKEKMTVDFGFSSGSETKENTEELHVYVPLAKEKRDIGPYYQILLGFQLSEDQLNEVRKEEAPNP